MIRQTLINAVACAAMVYVIQVLVRCEHPGTAFLLAFLVIAIIVNCLWEPLPRSQPRGSGPLPPPWRRPEPPVPDLSPPR